MLPAGDLLIFVVKFLALLIFVAKFFEIYGNKNQQFGNKHQRFVNKNQQFDVMCLLVTKIFLLIIILVKKVESTRVAIKSTEFYKNQHKINKKQQIFHWQQIFRWRLP